MGVFTADIFHLKEINKQLGYNAGNERIIALADLFRKVFAGYSMFRYDDDQILAVCHSVEQKQFQNMADYAKELIGELEFGVSYGYSWKAEPMVHDAIAEAEDYQIINRQYLEKEYIAAKKLAKKIEKDVLKQIEDGIGQITISVQNNSATAQETSAVSEELAAQATGLEEMLDKFVLSK
jgi:GGDEF domain-containing protein